MKKIYLLIILSFLFTQKDVLSQDTNALGKEYYKWSVGVNAGNRLVASPFIGDKATLISYYGINGTHWFNRRVGMMLDLGYNSFNTKQATFEIRNHYIRSSVQGVANFGELLKFDSWTKHLGLLMHGGVGVSVLMNEKDNRIKYNLDQKQDWMFNGIIGITPTLKLHKRVLLNMDLSYVTNSKQEWSYDMTSRPSVVAFKNHLVNWSIGATFFLGKTKTDKMDHPGEAVSEVKDSITEPIVVENDLNDDDGDGVPNYLDLEPNTPIGNLVDARGVTIVVEQVPEIDSAAIAEEIRARKREIIDNALKQVHFEFGTSKLSADSPERLAEFINVLKENPEFHLSIEGHTDHVGSVAFNQNLSIERAKSVYDELYSQGLDPDRMSIKGYGELRPKVPNTTPENRAINRRVELIIIEK